MLFSMEDFRFPPGGGVDRERMSELLCLNIEEISCKRKGPSVPCSMKKFPTLAF